jgi:hypothetical protein
MGDFIHFALAAAMLWVAFAWFHIGLPRLTTAAMKWKYYALALGLALGGVEHIWSALAHAKIAPWQTVGNVALILFAVAHLLTVLRREAEGSWWAPAIASEEV